MILDQKIMSIKIRFIKISKMVYVLAISKLGRVIN